MTSMPNPIDDLPCPSWCDPTECNTYETERAHGSLPEKWSAHDAEFQLWLSRIDDVRDQDHHPAPELILATNPRGPGFWEAGIRLDANEAIQLAARLVNAVATSQEG